MRRFERQFVVLVMSMDPGIKVSGVKSLFFCFLAVRPEVGYTICASVYSSQFPHIKMEIVIILAFSSVQCSSVA